MFTIFLQSTIKSVLYIISFLSKNSFRHWIQLTFILTFSTLIISSCGGDSKRVTTDGSTSTDGSTEVPNNNPCPKIGQYSGQTTNGGAIRFIIESARITDFFAETSVNGPSFSFPVFGDTQCQNDKIVANNVDASGTTLHSISTWVSTQDDTKIEGTWTHQSGARNFTLEADTSTNVDTDNDGVPDSTDNCPDHANTAQLDTDGNGIGDACDAALPDTDGDGIADNQDNCPLEENPAQVDSDGNGVGDACDLPPNAEPDVPNSQFYATGNNSAILTGPVVGDGSKPNSTIRKELLVSSSGNSPISVNRAYVTSSGLGTQLILVLQNTSEENHCFIRFKDITIYGSSGTEDAGSVVSESYAAGSLGFFSTINIYTDTCVAPDERSYLWAFVENAVVENMTSIETADFESRTINNLSSDKILPIQYTIRGQNLEVTVQNLSSKQLTLSYFFDFIVLDETGLPLGVGLGDLNNGFILEPGEEYVGIENRIGRFNGSSSTIRFVIGLQ